MRLLVIYCLLLFQEVPIEGPDVRFRDVADQFNPVERMALGQVDYWCARYGKNFSSPYRSPEVWLVRPHAQDLFINLAQLYLESTKEGGVFTDKVFRSLVNVDQSYCNLLEEARAIY